VPLPDRSLGRAVVETPSLPFSAFAKVERRRERVIADNIESIIESVSDLG